MLVEPAKRLVPGGWGRAVQQVSDTSRFLTTGQVARMLGVSSRTIDRWADTGRLPCFVTLGGHRRFEREDIVRVATVMGIEFVGDGGETAGPIDSFSPRNPSIR